ncbi:MAG: NAD-dependent epimerase/dehydratase family protein [Chitinophagaceae bacterium]|nr:NAD-dependent epimerase/dehydratase family protein [Chitinophagaceae bacterium]
MVIGNGLIAQRFAPYADNNQFLIFASGVSNSKTTNPTAYEREWHLLNDCLKHFPNQHFVYFSTCSIYDPEEMNSVYVQHKLRIEELIIQKTQHHHIFRISNLAGHAGNPNTVLNFFFYHVKQGINFDLWMNACRNIIDVDDAYHIIDHILQNDLFPNNIVNIANPVNYPVASIVNAIETFLDVQSDYIKINKGSCFDIDISLVQPLLGMTGLQANEHYLNNLLLKYFG